LGISPNQVHAWRSEYGAAKAEQCAARGGERLEEEVQRLRRENQSLKTDQEVLKNQWRIQLVKATDLKNFLLAKHMQAFYLVDDSIVLLSRPGRIVSEE
jgi:uncharacterized protein YjcR